METTKAAPRKTTAKRNHGLLWYVTWPLHVVPRWLSWWAKEWFVGLWLGLCQGVRIAWYELRARKILKECERQGIKLYDLDIWQLLRSITFARQARKGVVVCRGCKQPTHEPHCHHIKHVVYAPKLAFSPGNLVGLCPPCHQAEHPNVPGIDDGPRMSLAAHRAPLRRSRGLRKKHRALRPEDLNHG